MMPDGGLCLKQTQVPDALIPHKTFTGNRPSSSIMLPDLSAYTTGQILALYEHVTAAMVRSGAHAINDENLIKLKVDTDAV